MTERDRLLAKASAYMMFGDVDKDFHRPECSCKSCDGWRTLNGRPTHAECREHLAKQKEGES